MSGAIYATGDIIALSDASEKENITTIKNALHLVSRMRGVNYVRKDTGESKVGVIAQDLQKVLPEVVKPAPFDINILDNDGNTTSKSGENYLTVQYEKIVPLLVAAIQELNDKVNNLEEQLKNK